MSNRAHQLTQNPPVAANADVHLLPAWLLGALRSDHAGETGAVMIYRGILAGSRNKQVRAFAQSHLATEQAHLELMEVLVADTDRTRLLPVWRLLGWLTGFIPALFGPKAVFSTVQSVEEFVDIHYGEQVARLSPKGPYADLRALMAKCRSDEIDHRDEAAALAGLGRSIPLRIWCAVVGLGSRLAVAVARRF